MQLHVFAQGPRALRVCQTVALLFAPILMTGCSIIFGHRDDPVRAVKIHEIADHTQDVLTEAQAGKLSAAESRAYLEQSIAILTELRTREASGRADAEELARLAELQTRFEKVRARGTPVRTSDGPALQRGIYAIQEHNRLPGPRQPASSDSSSSSTSETDTTTTDEKCKDKDKDKDKGKDSKKRDRDDCDDRRGHKR